MNNVRGDIIHGGTLFTPTPAIKISRSHVSSCHKFLFRAQQANMRMTFEADSCVRGYHTYSAVLVATVGDVLESNYSVHRNVESQKNPNVTNAIGDF